MKNKGDRNIEKLVDKMMVESLLESPSVDFTSKIMSAILNPASKKALVYKPVISKRAWFIIFAAIIALFAFLIFSSAPSTLGDNFNFTFFYFDKFTNPFSRIQISSMTTNVLLAAALMLFIQIFLLKNYLNKKFEK